MKIKICGLFREEDIQYVNEVKPDYIGFVFAKSKRQVTYQQASKLRQLLNKDIKAVGVFVNEDINFIVKLVNNHIIDIIQLHGSENDDYISRIKNQTDVPIIKAIKVSCADDLNVNYNVDYYLLDNKVSGSGKSFDWSLIKKMDKPVFLAGGISLENIDQAIDIADYGIDVSSGVETNGIKDFNKIKEIVRRVRNGKR